ADRTRREFAKRWPSRSLMPAVMKNRSGSSTQLRNKMPRLAALASLAVASCVSAPAQVRPDPLFDRHLRAGQYFMEKKQYGRAVSGFESAVALEADRAE